MESFFIPDSMISALSDAAYAGVNGVVDAAPPRYNDTFLIEVKRAPRHDGRHQTATLTAERRVRISDDPDADEPIQVSQRTITLSARTYSKQFLEADNLPPTTNPSAPSSHPTSPPPSSSAVSDYFPRDPIGRRSNIERNGPPRDAPAPLDAPAHQPDAPGRPLAPAIPIVVANGPFTRLVSRPRVYRNGEVRFLARNVDARARFNTRRRVTDFVANLPTTLMDPNTPHLVDLAAPTAPDPANPSISLFYHAAAGYIYVRTAIANAAAVDSTPVEGPMRMVILIHEGDEVVATEVFEGVQHTQGLALSPPPSAPRRKRACGQSDNVEAGPSKKARRGDSL